MLLWTVHVLFVIPARIGSSRIPRKPLRLLHGEPLVRRVVRNALVSCGWSHVVVAADDQRVLEAVSDLDVDRVMSSPLHNSGTERVAEVMMRPEYADYNAAVNLQCDQVSAFGHATSSVLRCLGDGFPLATCAVPLAPRDLTDPNRVKVEIGSGGQALAFSRSAIHPERSTDVMLHVGIYAYTRSALSEWIALPAVAAEAQERLEQLRPLEHGMPIAVAVLDEPAPTVIDTSEDLRRARLAVPGSTAEPALRISV